jgi:hypothetical protein
VARDLGSAVAQNAPARVFDLGNPGGSDIAKDKHAMIARATGDTSSASGQAILAAGDRLRDPAVGYRPPA